MCCVTSYKEKLIYQIFKYFVNIPFNSFIIFSFIIDEKRLYFLNAWPACKSMSEEFYSDELFPDHDLMGKNGCV